MLIRVAIALALFFILAASVDAGAADPLSFNVVSTTDLTATFHTKAKWSLVVTAEPDDSGISDVVGNLHFCFVRNGKEECPDICLPSGVMLDDSPTCLGPDGRQASVPYNVFQDSVPYNVFRDVSTYQAVGSGKANLVVARVAWTGGASGFPSGPIIWAYHRQSDSFSRIFSAVENPSNNGQVRFITGGPLAGDVILNQLTYSWPYRYEIIVYKLLRSAHYVKVLDYKGNSTEGDGNTLAVIDAEMPEIERRLGFWRRGQTLPEISQDEIPSQCTTPLRLQKGLEWCDWSD